MVEVAKKLSGIRDYVFENWSKTYTCYPELYFEPTTTDEIKQIMEEALKQNKKVKVLGCGHSPSDIMCTSDFMVSMRKFNKVLNVNKEMKQVTAQAGMTLHEFEEEIRKYGLGIPLIPSISDVTLGGTIATGTHGTGAEFGILATKVVDLTLLAGTRELIYCSKDKNKDIFDAARCHLGAMGIILEVTWQCEDAFKLCSQRNPQLLSDVLDNLDSEMAKSEHSRVLWWPHTDNVAVWSVNRTDKAIKFHKSWFWDRLIGFHFVEFALWISSFIPWLTKFINRYHFSLFMSKPEEVVDESEKVFTFDCLFKQYVTDWAIPRDQTAFVLKRLKKWIDESGFNAHMPVEVRFAKGDDILVSPAYGRDTCFINIIMFRPYGKFIPHEDYWNFYEDLMLSVGGRPHWAKAHKLGPANFEQLYPRFEDFRNICRKLDPGRLFVNDYLERTIFGAQERILNLVKQFGKT